MFQFRKNSELQETVEKQKSQITRYESRLRDLVAAYKSLQNEKQALEASVKALTASPQSQKRSKSHLNLSTKASSQASSRRTSLDSSKSHPKQEGESNEDQEGNNEVEKQNEEDSEANSQDGDPEEVSDDESELESLRHQIITLTSSLSTVTEEKSKMVATFTAERKKIKSETDAQITELRDEVEALRSKKTELEEELIQAKEKIRAEQEGREQEQSTQSIMLREIQKMLNDERNRSEQLAQDLEDSRKATQKAESDIKKIENSEKESQKIEQEVEILKNKLKAAREEAKIPPPIIGKLQKEIAEMKAANRIQLEKEHMQFISSEERLKKVELESEERVSSLEEQITQLSAQMGNYETIKSRDEKQIRMLRERIVQLEAENSILAKQVASGQDCGIIDPLEVDDVEKLKERVIKLKGLLKTAVQKSGEVFDTDGWIVDMNGKMENDDYQKMYIECQQELQHVRDEFDKYKVRAQSVLKTKRESIVTKESAALIATQQQYQDLKDELEEVKERHFHLRSHCDGLEERQTKLIKQHDEELMRRHLEHQKVLATEKEIYASKILDAEQEMRSQRERTVALLAEKDKEIQHLKAYSDACHREYQNEYRTPSTGHSRQLSTSSEYVFHGTENLKEVNDNSVADIMTHGNKDSSTMIHYAEQMARKDISINGLRRQKKQLEVQIRQLQDAIITKDEKYSRELAELKETVSDFNRTKSRANANLEYLKNVMFQYLTTNKDQSARNRMLTAVTAILQFSPEEIRKVMKR